jgi:TrmH family RNA methyltransferase
MLERIRIVLVGPSGPANVGAVCRIMVNMGLSDLVLVSPRCGPRDKQAVAYAAHAGPLLESARVVDTIPEALLGCVRTFAATAKTGLYRRQAALPVKAAAHDAVEHAVAGPVAFALGPENHGFVTRELLLFDGVVTIASDGAYPVLNLAAAATIICYELRQASLAARGRLPKPGLPSLAPDERKQALFDKLFDGLDGIGFFDTQQNPDHLKHALRHLFGRLDMTINEVDILIGMACQMRWYADNFPRPCDPPR